MEFASSAIRLALVAGRQYSSTHSRASGGVFLHFPGAARTDLSAKGIRKL